MRYSNLNLRFVTLAIFVALAACSPSSKDGQVSNMGNGNLLVNSNLATGQVAQTVPAVFSNTFKGAFGGKHNVVIVLRGNGQVIEGTVKHADGVENTLKGSLDAQRQFVLDENWEGVQVIAKWRGQFTSPNEIEGVRVDTRDQESLPFKLKATSAGADTPAMSAEAAREATILAAREDGYEGVDAEAYAEASLYWEERLTKCGDSYCFAVENRIYADPNAAQPRRWYEGKEYSVSVSGKYHPPKQLTEAQKMNNVDPQPVEWEGTAKLTFNVGRQIKSRGYGYDGAGPGRWQDKYTEERKVVKRKGRWEVYYSPVFKDVKVSCAEVSSILGRQ